MSSNTGHNVNATSRLQHTTSTAPQLVAANAQLPPNPEVLSALWPQFLNAIQQGTISLSGSVAGLPLPAPHAPSHPPLQNAYHAGSVSPPPSSVLGASFSSNTGDSTPNQALPRVASSLTARPAPNQPSPFSPTTPFFLTQAQAQSQIQTAPRLGSFSAATDRAAPPVRPLAPHILPDSSHRIAANSQRASHAERSRDGQQHRRQRGPGRSLPSIGNNSGPRTPVTSVSVARRRGSM